MRRRIDLDGILGRDLLAIEKPARYIGGEYGAVPALSADEEPGLFIALSFPDLYEIGMSNNAIRILYDGLNRRPDIRCERVFAPAPDFERLLRDRAIPLPTLESGIAVADADILGFSVGYELAATSLLTILDRAGIPLSAIDRGEGDPIVIGGGPALSNPHYLAKFFDSVWIGEAEDRFFDLCEELAALKRSGASRAQLLDRLAGSPHVWMPGKKARRAVYESFPTSPYRMTFPVPVLKPVQAHGTVEIMRGCPHGCRFCQAGFYYRPQRMKEASLIQDEVRELVERGGYSEITLSSLSSGDYAGIGDLLASLNATWASRGVSFQLPSLKVNTFTLPLIEALSEVRKSGLTFAVESPDDFRQLVINKDVSFDKLAEIITEARKRGFRSAKFYFMIGLPVPGRGVGEAQAIVDFFSRLIAIHPISYNVNVGVFVPKPHTPFQWCGQLPEDEAMEAVQVLRSGLRDFRSIKLSWHSPFVSLLESIFARGDERVGELILEAWKRGARLDAWDEHFDRERWRAVLEEASWNPVKSVCEEVSTDASLPWDDVSILVSKQTFKKEWYKSQDRILTSSCTEECTTPCGVCSDSSKVVYNHVTLQVEKAAESANNRGSQVGRLILRMSKSGKAIAFPHLGIMEAIMRAFQIAKIPISMSEGFNPAPRMELSPPLPLGVSSRDDYAAVVLSGALEVAPGTSPAWLAAIQVALPTGLLILESRLEAPRADGRKFASIGAAIWGSVYRLSSKSGFDFAHLADSLSELAATRAIDTFKLEAVGDSLDLRLPSGLGKANNLHSLLEECLDARSLALLSIERLQILATDEERIVPLREKLGFA